MLTVEEGLAIVQSALDQEQLTKIQILVFRKAWEGLSYDEIARSSGYDNGHVKNTGSQLWQLLSEMLGEKVTKHNFQLMLKRYQQRQAVWLEGKAAEQAAADAGETSSSRSSAVKADWGEAIDVSLFYNRTEELTTLEQWIRRDRCRLIGILGMGGMGKTALSVKLAKQVQDQFECVIWRSLRDAPPLNEWLAIGLRLLSEGETSLPETEAGKLSQLMQRLRDRRCLLILDNFDALFQSGQRAGIYRPGYEGYGELLQRLGEGQHQSCLILTSRDKPPEIGALQGENLPVRAWSLQGLQPTEAAELLHLKGLRGSIADLTTLVQCYGGNPLALKITATSIQDLFAGSVADFLQQGTVVFNGIRHLLGQQIDRLSELELKLMYWLAINREPVSEKELQADVIPLVPQPDLLEALESLRWRCLIETAPRSLVEKSSDGFTQQPIVMEYMTEKLIGQVFKEIVVAGQGANSAAAGLPFLKNYALIKATAKDYIRSSQIRFILEPLIEQVLMELGSKRDLADRLSQMLWQLRVQTPMAGYAGGNLINLLCHLRTDLTGSDFSHLTVWQAYLADVDLHQSNFAGADLAKSVFAETFGGITAVAFSPDGGLLATSDTSGETQIWNTITGTQITTLRTDAAWTCAVAFAPQHHSLNRWGGEILASAGDDYLVKLWDIDSGECMQVLKGHQSTVNAIAFSRDGSTLASCSQDGSLRLWTTRRLNKALDPCLRIFTGHQGRVWSVAISPDGTLLASGSEDCTIKLWDVASGECRQTLSGHTHWVKAVAFSPDGTTLASGSFDCAIGLWAVSTGECLALLQGHRDAVTAVAFSPDGQRLASGSYDQTVKIWQMGAEDCTKTLHEHSNRVLSVAFGPTGHQLASGGDDHAARLWNIHTERCIRTWKGHTNGILTLALSADQRRLATGHQDQTIKIWDCRTGQMLKTLRGHANRVWSVAFAPETAAIVASGSGDRAVKLWNTQTGQCISTLHSHTSWVWSVTFSADGQRLASGSCDHAIRLWDVRTGQCLNTFDGHQAPVISVIFSADQRRLISSSADTTIKIWDIASATCLQTLTGHRNSVWAIALSPDGEQLASCSYDETIKLWDLTTGCCTRTLAGHSGAVVTIAFHPNGQQLASGSFDQTIKLWNLQSGECDRTLSGHTALVSAIVFPGASDDAPVERLISGSFDETIRVWDASTGSCLHSFRTPRPYEGMVIAGARGLSEAQKATLRALGANEYEG